MAQHVSGWMAAVLVVLAPAAAGAESAIVGCQAATIMGSKGTLPRDAPGIPVRRSSVTPDATFDLIDDQGTHFPTTTSASTWPFDSLWIIAPIAPPAEGHYVLSYKEGCQWPLPVDPPVAKTFPLDFGSEQPLPSSMGTVKIKATPTTLSTNRSADCIESVLAADVSIEWIPSLELAPFLPVTLAEVVVNQKAWTALAKDSLTTTVQIACDPAQAVAVGRFNRLASIVLRGTVAGADRELDPIDVPIDMICPVTVPPPQFSAGCTVDADTDALLTHDASDSDGGGLKDLDADAPSIGSISAPPSGAPVDPAHSGCSCSLGAVGHRKGWAAGVLVLLGLCATTRRRARRFASSTRNTA